QATFFCVASEIESSEKIKNVVRLAIQKGHYIANHTYSHPFGLNELNPEESNDEISKANLIFQENFNIRPLGFRAPGYAIDTATVNTLEKHGLRYDSSAAWLVFHLIFKFLRFAKSGSGDGNM